MTNISKRQLELIEAAGKILTTSGVGGLTIKNLAIEMQFSESAIYRHFSGKEEVIVAMLNYLANSMDERYKRAIKNDMSPIDKFNALFKSQFQFFQQNPHFIVAVFSDGLMEGSQKINQALLNVMTVKVKHLLPIIIEGQESGLFTKNLKPKVLMHITMGTVRLQMYKWRVGNFKMDIEKNGNEIVQALLSIIKEK
jgi:TetR/AcrR family transcriptional regulator, fatty acid metabolism regulator protein